MEELMRRECGITMVALVFTVTILMIITGIVLYYSIGDNGAINNSAKIAFKQDMNQIKELVKEKETTYRLEEIVDYSIFTESVKRTILEDYYDKMEITITASSDGEPVLTLYYRPTMFSEEEIQWLGELGIPAYNK